MVQILQRTSPPKAVEGGFQAPSSADMEIVMQKLNQVQQELVLKGDQENVFEIRLHASLEVLLEGSSPAAPD